MTQLDNLSKKIIDDALVEKEKILNEAKEEREKILNDAKEKAKKYWKVIKPNLNRFIRKLFQTHSIQKNLF